MTYVIKAIPTTYAGVNFRSRLEARWAAFFDLCGWRWDYEPFDLDGWAPDFLLKGKIKALVEVKPVDFRGPDRQLYAQALVHGAKAFGVSIPRKDGALPEYEALVIGNGPFKGDRWSLGVFAAPRRDWDDVDRELYAGNANDPTFGCDVADLYFGQSAHLDYAARYGDYRYRIGGEYDGDHHLMQIGGDDPVSIWREAGNIVQWQPDRRRRRRAA